MTEIKISDLSIGDWVKCNGFKATIAGYNAESGSIQVLTKQKNKMWFGIEHIEPIPLTPEILEKNGFEENCGRWYNSEALMEFEQYKDGWCRTINCGEYSVYFIKYVHQLQHALRLTGVEKEIEV